MIEDVDGAVSGTANAELGQTRAGDPADAEGNEGGQRTGGQQQKQSADDLAGNGDGKGVPIANGGHSDDGVPDGFPQAGDGGVRRAGFQSNQQPQQQKIHSHCRGNQDVAAFFHRDRSFAARSTLGRASTLRTSMSL